MAHKPLSQLEAKNAQLSGWIRQLQKQIKHFGDLTEEPDTCPTIEEQVLFVQQQYELLSLLYDVSLGFDNPNGAQKIIGVDVDLIEREAAKAGSR